jgi:hypothetical protein
MLSKEEIQEIITYEVVVDCYDKCEAEMGWAIFMSENINYPFIAEYEVRKASGERHIEKVNVVGSESGESNFSMDVFYAEIELHDMVVPADIEELKIIEADEMTLRTIEVWKHRNSF